jgi:apolipoprotein N-acyltransferase
VKKIPFPDGNAVGASNGIAGRHAGVKPFFENLGLVFLSVLLFAGAFPNLLIENGFPLFAWVAYAPIFILIYRISPGASVFWGALYGFAAYGLFNYWLGAFHPLAGIIVTSIYMVFLAALFFLLKLAVIFFPRRGYLVQWLLWLAYEYLSALGFLGYSYGITGYSQWRIIPLIQIASVFGVWGVSALVTFPSAWLAAAYSQSAVPQQLSNAVPYGQQSPVTNLLSRIKNFFHKEKFSAVVWAAALVAALCFGLLQKEDYSSAPSANIALIQHNTDPWKGGVSAYRDNLAVLKRLSNEAMAAQPKPDLVVWSETAFVPRIYWHETYRDDHDSWRLVKELLDYFAVQDVPFVIGNDDARKDPAKNPDEGESYRVDYNAAMLFEKGKNTALYRKLHLVPFTEHFPYKKQLPFVYDALVKADTHFWEKGTEEAVFSVPGFAFSTPICFEDTFGYLSRKFVQNGADVIVNLSNDAWSKSLPAQNQHLSMAVFRAVENRRSMVRATASGQTCGILPNGRVIAMAPPFAEAWLTVEIPLVKGYTAYTRCGDFLAIGFLAAAIILLIIGGISCIVKKNDKGR